MRVAIIGGTGFVGGYLTDALLKAGHSPSLLVRAGSESSCTNPAVSIQRRAISPRLGRCGRSWTDAPP